MRTALLLTALMLASPVAAQTVEDVNNTIDNVLGDHTKFEEAFHAVQSAVADNDAEAFAAWVAYPIGVNIEGEDTVLETPEALVEQYDSFMTEEITAAVTGQRYEEVLVNFQGIMFGEGQVWINGVCTDDECSEFDARVITIQSVEE
jgi:hypothetical protein